MTNVQQELKTKTQLYKSIPYLRYLDLSNTTSPSFYPFLDGPRLPSQFSVMVFEEGSKRDLLEALSLSRSSSNHQKRWRLKRSREI